MVALAPIGFGHSSGFRSCVFEKLDRPLKRAPKFEIVGFTRWIRGAVQSRKRSRRSPRLSVPGRVVASLTVALLLVVLGAAAANATTPVVSVSVGSIGRDASSKLTFDVTATTDAVQGAGGVCTSSQYACTVSLYAQRVDGTTAPLQNATIPWGASFPHANEFIGSAAISKVIAVQAQVQGNAGLIYSGWTSVTDPIATSVVSVSVGSVGRDASSKLTFDVTATTSVAQGVGRICTASQYTCTVSLSAQLADGTATPLQSATIAWGATFPYANEFIGSATISKVIAVQTQVQGNAGVIYSGWTPVTDPLSTASGTGSVSVSVTSVGRDASTGNLTYDLSASVSGASSTNGPCGGQSYHCYLWVQTLSPSGDISTLTSSDLPSQASYTKNFVGSTSRTKITAIRAYTTGYYAPGPFYSSWVAVTDLYLDRSVAITAASVGRDASTGNLTYNLLASVSGSSLLDGPCGGSSYHCYLYVQTLSATGDINTLTSSDLPSQASYTKNFVGSASRSKITAIRAYTAGYSSLASFYSPWVLVHDRDKSESVGGGNAAEKGCECNNGDPVNAQTGEFYETETDLGVPGVGPAVAVGRTYSSLSAAVNGPFGYSTTSNFGSRLVIDSGGDSTDPLPRQVHVVQENGATVPFSEASNGTYPAAPWVLATLTHSATSGNWTFTRDKKQVFVFDSNGALISTSDLHGNTVIYGYTSGKVTSITGSGGREVDLTWTSGRVTSVTDSASRSVSYVYDSSGNLSSVDTVDGGIWQYSYDSSHRMLTETKPAGGLTTNVYNSTGQVTSQTDPVGRVTTFAYSGLSTTVTLPGGSVTTYTFNQGQPAAITTATGTALASTTTYTYDADGNRVSETDPLGHTTSYTYDSAGNALTTTDPLGKVTTRTYDYLRDVTSVEDPLGRTTTLTYNSDGGMTSLTTPGSHTTSWTLNSGGTIASSTDARSKTTTFTYDTAGRSLCVTDPDSRQTCQAYDSRGFATSKTDAAGKVTGLTYDDAGRVLTVTDPNSHTTTYTYDGDGNLISTEDASSHSVTAAHDGADQRTSRTDGRGKTTSYTYSARGSLATVTDPNGHVTTNAYDAQNQLTSTTDAESRVTSFGYDLAGHKTSTILPSMAVTSSTYGADGRVLTSTDARGKVTNYAYDDAGQLTSVTDPLSRVTSYSYTSDGKLHVTTLPDTSTETHAYDADGAQTSFTNADGDVTGYSYDDAGLLSSETQPGGLTTSYSYDTAGHLSTTTKPDSSTSTNSYDDAGQLTRVHYSATGSTDTTYSYSPVGSRIGMTDATGTSAYTYNSTGQLTGATNGSGTAVSYGYDNAGQLISLGYPGTHTATYGYDNAGHMTSLTDWNSNTTNFTWTVNGQLATQADPNGVTQSRSYDPAGQTTAITTTTTSATLATYSYGYDAASQLTADSTTDPTVATVAHSYTYDAIHQLASTTSGGTTSNYAATSAGLLAGTAAGATLSYNAAQQLTGLTPASGPSTSYAYDGSGSRTSSVVAAVGTAPAATTGYTYTASAALATVTLPGSSPSTVSYASDGDGLRQTRTVGSTTTGLLWETAGSLPLLLDDGTHTYLYGPSSAPVAQIDDSTGSVQYLHGDLLGSTRQITDSTGTVLSTSTYDAYGNRTNHTGTTDSTIGYTGNWTDPDTGLVYLRARDYDAATGQFLTVDPAIDTTHQPYAYTANNPLLLTDPTGLCTLTWTSNCIAGYLGQELGRIGNFLVGIGNGATFGGVSAVDDFILPGSSCTIPKDGFYYSGYVVGAIATLGVSAGVGGAQAEAKSAAVERDANSENIVLGLRSHGLEETAAKFGGRTLLKDSNWQDTLKTAIADPSANFTVSLDGMSGSSTYSQVMSAAQRGASGLGGYTDWEMSKLYQAGRLPDVTLVRGGSVVGNPFGQ
jgi:RHS repeat-associated protein